LATADIPADPPAKPRQGVILISGTFDELVYGAGSSEADVQARLDIRLQQKLEKVDRICGLTDTQKRKLQLAGRGDIKRLIDRAEKLRAKCDGHSEIANVNHFRKWTEELRSETNVLRQSFDAGPPAADSLLAKCMKAVLTAEQISKFALFGATPPYQPPQRGPARLEGAIELR
jgi:hypothetical protein